jgi:endonuclease YncB( thermonuclease family)
MQRAMLRLLVLTLVLPAALALFACGDSETRESARQSPPAAAGEEETGLRAREIVDGDTLVLDDWREVRLVGVQAPKLPLGRPDFPTWPLAEEAKAALGALVLGRALRLVYTGRPMDRHGRQLAHVYAGEADGSETWVQGALLEAGMARVYSFPDNRALVGEMLARETAARHAGRGIWADPFYAIRSPEETAAGIDTFQVIEGRVLGAAVVRGRAYLNFGADWKQDFTVTLAPAVRRLFEAEGHDPRAYEGRRIRVRGWLKSFNGPMIEATHPEQIELLEP